MFDNPICGTCHKETFTIDGVFYCHSDDGSPVCLNENGEAFLELAQEFSQCDLCAAQTEEIKWMIRSIPLQSMVFSDPVSMSDGDSMSAMSIDFGDRWGICDLCRENLQSYPEGYPLILSRWISETSQRYGIVIDSGLVDEIKALHGVVLACWNGKILPCPQDQP